MKRVVVTGATGFVGRSVVEAFLGCTEDIKIFCLYKGASPALDDRRFVWIECDLEDISTHQQLMNEIKPTHCIHLAWYVPPKEFWHASKNIDWIYVSAKFFEAFCAAGGKYFLGAGSIAEYDMSGGNLDEKLTPLLPNSLYGEAKKTLFLLLQQIKRQNYPQVVLLWARIGYFFGESQPQEKLFTKVFKSLLLEDNLKVMAATTRRPYAHIKYLGQALLKALFSIEHDMIFNVSSSSTYSLEQIVEALAKSLAKGSSPIIYGGYKPPLCEPEKIEISVKNFEDTVKWSIPDTFISDVSLFARNLYQKNYQ